MKRIFLALSLLVAASGASLAQSAPAPAPAPAPAHPAPPVVSKTDFTTKVGEFNTLIGNNNIDAANAKWREIAQMVNGEMVILRYKMQDAMDAHNDADKAHYMELSKTQRMLYAQTMQLKNDMIANKAAINEKLTAFAGSML